MKKRNILNLIVFFILIAIAIYLYYSQKTNTLKKELSDFAVEDTASITKIFLADKGGNTITLKRLNKSQWELNKQYEARADAIENLLTTIKRVTVKSPVQKVSFENIVKQLASNSVKVEIYQGEEKPTKVYFVGGPNQEHNGTYMLMKNSTVPFLTHIEGFYGYLTPRYFIDENAWRNTVLFSYKSDEIASVKLEYTEYPKKSFMIKDLGNNNFEVLSLAKAEPITDFDTTKVKQYLVRYKTIHYESSEETKTQAFIDSVKQSTPMRIYTVTDRNGKVKEVKAFLKPPPEGGKGLFEEPITRDVDRFYGLIDNNDFVVLQYFVFDPLTWTVDDFVKSRDLKK